MRYPFDPFRTPKTAILLFNLTLADLAYSLTLPLLALELFDLEHWKFGRIACKVSRKWRHFATKHSVITNIQTLSFLLLVNLYGSVYFLSTIALGKAYFIRQRSCKQNLDHETLTDVPS